MGGGKFAVIEICVWSSTILGGKENANANFPNIHKFTRLTSFSKMVKKDIFVIRIVAVGKANQQWRICGK